MPLVQSLRRLLAGALLCAALPAVAAPAADDRGIESRTLDNGLQVIVWPDHDIPNVALYTFYKVGGRNEYPGITGIAHYFEHMMFNGTQRRAPGSFDREMEAAGGSNNAYTSNDLTVYQDWFPVTSLETIFDLEGDRMANLDFDPKVVESERGVVYSERRTRVDNDNFGALFEQLMATAFVAHPYQFPVIGWPSDIENWTIDQLRDFYRTYYAPNNAVMLVVGAVEPRRVFELAEQYIGKIPAQPAPRPVTTVEPEQQGERRVVVNKAAQVPILAMGYHATRAADPDSTALELLAAILGQGRSSRLNQALVEQAQAAVQAGTSFRPGFDPSLFLVYAVGTPGGDLGKLEALVDAELDKLVKEGIAESELEKARNQALASFWRSQATISGKAQALGSYQVFHGDYRKLFEAPERFAAVTSADIQRVAARVLRRENRTVGTLVPTAED
ncbi:M16 family metallopeptidase [Pseudomarimonas salicorniae]|uniref:Insulinase family protein n=1 Tax=Pseudomarimonas salicorniae TaxID=2933270 RepID=A0ABT0GKS1_9GAMM|nr:pitrilysin family protein [Lysobacter sp. CAU 1642]MCK7594977.1 insulinase family protein [Lysobacter sp. CAU 1642]